MKKLIFLFVIGCAVFAKASLVECANTLATLHVLDASIYLKKSQIFLQTSKVPKQGKIFGYLYTQNHTYRCGFFQEGNSIETHNLLYSYTGQNPEEGVLNISAYSYPRIRVSPEASDTKGTQGGGDYKCTSEKSLEVTDKLHKAISKAISILPTICNVKDETKTDSCREKLNQARTDIKKQCRNLAQAIDTALEIKKPTADTKTHKPETNVAPVPAAN